MIPNQGFQQVMRTIPVLEAALNYAARGWPVIPLTWPQGGRCSCKKADCLHPAKHPLTTNGLKDATTDPEVIKSWWRKWPQANVSIVTGQKSGLLVLDIDPRNGGNESLKRLPGNLPLTPSTSTGGGGEHYFLKHPGDGFKIPAKLPGYTGIDFKGDGGYIVAPPSGHISGQKYSWQYRPETTPLAPIPPWLLELLMDKGQALSQTASPIDKAIPQGQRNETLTSLAGSMRRGGMTPEEIEMALQTINRNRCSPPLPEKEVARIAQSIGRYPPEGKNNRHSSEQPDYLPLPPSFPLEVFPPALRHVVEEVAGAHGVPVEIPACVLLITAGGCIGRVRGLRIKGHWVEHANMWLAIVGMSGLGKSPATRTIQSPLVAIERDMWGAYREESEVYERLMDEYHRANRKERGDIPPKPIPPVWHQVTVDDTTTEALAVALNNNPRGILWNRDELSGLILDLDKYSGKEGGTKARLMSSYDSGPWKMNRRDKGKQLFIPHACLSIYGTIQPRALPAIFSQRDADTGFLPRFLFVGISRETPALWTEIEVSHASLKVLRRLYDGLLALTFHEGKEEEDASPGVIGVTPGAKEVYIPWFNEQAVLPWLDHNAADYQAVLAKLQGQALRVALILHCLWALMEGTDEMSPVTAETMQRAVILANFFRDHQKRAWQYLTKGGGVQDLNPTQLRVAAAILSLEGEIQSGVLATERITVVVNGGVDERFHLSTKSVGKLVSSLGLLEGSPLDKNKRGWRITPEDLDKFKNIFRTTAGNAGTPGTMKVFRLSSNAGQTPQAHTGQPGVSAFSASRGHLDLVELPSDSGDIGIYGISGSSIENISPTLQDDEDLWEGEA